MFCFLSISCTGLTFLLDRLRHFGGITVEGLARIRRMETAWLNHAFSQITSAPG